MELKLRAHSPEGQHGLQIPPAASSRLLVRLNVSKAGVKTSIGKRTTTVSIRGDRVRGAVRIPRTGLSYSE